MTPKVVHFLTREEIDVDPDPPLPQAPSLANSGSGGHDSGMSDERLTKLEAALAGVQGAVEGLRHSQNLTMATLGLIVAVMLGGFAIVFDELSDIGPMLRQEFSAMRAEMSAQTSAIANSITATKAQAPQVILVPAPQPEQPKK